MPSSDSTAIYFFRASWTCSLTEELTVEPERLHGRVINVWHCLLPIILETPSKEQYPVDIKDVGTTGHREYLGGRVTCWIGKF